MKAFKKSQIEYIAKILKTAEPDKTNVDAQAEWHHTITLFGAMLKQETPKFNDKKFFGTFNKG